jgi:hypothetical protein
VGHLSLRPLFGRTRQFTTANGLPSNTVYALQPDSRGRLWASTDQGLATIDRRNGEVTNVSFLDGLEREYRRMAMARLARRTAGVWQQRGAVVVNPLHIGRLNYHARYVSPTWPLAASTVHCAQHGASASPPCSTTDD